METISRDAGWEGSVTSYPTTPRWTNSTLFPPILGHARLNGTHGGSSFFWPFFENNSTAIPPVTLVKPRVRDQALAQAEIGILGLILALTTLGNSLVLWVLLRRRKYNAPMHLFMVNLCVADLVVAFFQVLPQLVWDITERFQGPDGLCRTVKYLQVVGMFASSYMIVAMTVDRHYAICCPLQAYRGGTVSRWNAPIIVAWVLALVLSIPQVFIFSRTEMAPGVYECWGHFAESWGLKAYVTWMTLAVFVLPAFIITVCQVRIFREIHDNIYLKSERVVSANIKKNMVLFRFPNIKKNAGRTNERARGMNGPRESRLLEHNYRNPIHPHCNAYKSKNAPQTDCCTLCPYRGMPSEIKSYQSCHHTQSPDVLLQNHTHANQNNSAPFHNLGQSQLQPTEEDSGCYQDSFCYHDSNSPLSTYPVREHPYPHRNPSLPPLPGVSRAMSKTVRMTLVIVLVYVVCWSPFFIVQLWAAWDPNPPEQGVAFTILMLLASLNSCTNPWIYTAFSNSVSRELRTLVCYPSRSIRRGSLPDDSSGTNTSISKDNHC
ncbi:vasopressin V2 receptor [Chanos chanos]|uniref:Vasopressin V2 receptor n=1 Tax=Chanos chanos TaxID=29144 RepID=A0A6J2UVQ6_CHACN|nr:vasopressin V2 receptor-like [Chanos chanos]